MLVVVALGGNALLQRGQPMTADMQRGNIRIAAQALAPVAKQHQLVLSHGNGPQVGLLALQSRCFARMMRIRRLSVTITGLRNQETAFPIFSTR